MSAEIQKTNGVAKLEWTPERVKLIQDTVAKGSSQDEFKLLLYIAGKYELDPLLKQIWCVKYGNNPASIYTGRDGFLSIAHRSGKFNGMNTVPTFDTGGKLISATCKVYRKDFDYPIEVTVYIQEYSSSTNPIAKSKPITMLCKVAESQALRKAFDISGLYGEDEQGAIEKTEDVKGVEVLSDDLKKQITEAKTESEVKAIWDANKGLQKKTFFAVEISTRKKELKAVVKPETKKEPEHDTVVLEVQEPKETPIEEAIPVEETGASLEISAMIDEATELSQLTEIYKANQDIKGNAHFLGALNKAKIRIGKGLTK